MKKTSTSFLEHFRAIFKDFPDAISVNRLNDGQNLAVNRSFTALTGFATAKVGSWISFEDWNRLVAEVRKRGLADGLAITLHTKTLGARQAQITARRIDFEGAPSLLLILSGVAEPSGVPETPRQREPGSPLLFDNAAAGIALADSDHRNKAEESLRANEEKYRAIFSAGTNAIFLTDPSSGAILEANPAACRIYGYSLPELLGMRIASLSAACDAPEGATSPLNVSLPVPYHQKKDGSIFPVEISVNPLKQSGLIANLAIVRDITERRRVEIEREGLLAEVQQAHAQLQSLSAQLFVAQEIERRNIAYDLHDEIGQAILAIKANLETLQLANESAALAEQIAASVKIADAALEQIRSLALDLRPAMLDDFGLVATLEWYLERQARSGRLMISFQSDLPDELRFGPMIETAGFRIAQTAIMNVVRHSQAQRVHVTLALVDAGRELELVIRDDGVGFNVAAALEQAQQGQSLGLLGLQERVRLVGGSSSIKSTPGLGTEVRVRFPVQGARGSR